jgi:hypothetical protein
MYIKQSQGRLTRFLSKLTCFLFINNGQMSFIAVGGISTVLFALLLGLYLHINDKRLSRIPDDALALSAKRCTPENVRSLTAELAESPISSKEQLPPKTGRRYIVVGGVRSPFAM